MRRLRAAEVEELLSLDVPARLASVDGLGFPHVTPLWFLWADGAFWMTSLAGRPQVARLRANPRACVLIDVEEPERADGERPNHQVRALGHATLEADHDGALTRRITCKYLRGPAAGEMADRRAGQERVVIRLEPVSLVALASV